MEGKEDPDDPYNLFQNVGSGDYFYFDAFPFNETNNHINQSQNLNQLDQNKENLDYLIFPWVDNNYDPFNVEDVDSHKNLMDCDKLLEKLSKFEENYNNLLKNNIMASPTANVRDKFSENFESNLVLAEGTLPGLLISIMHKENCPISESSLLSQVFPKFEDLRKVNGSKYSGDIHKVLKSTLSSSGIFLKTVDGKFYFKEKEALDYIIKITEKVLTKKLEKEKKELKTNSKVASSTSSKKKKNQSFSAQMNYKICKVYNILDKMLTRCRGDIDEKLNSHYSNGSIQLLQQIGGQNKLVGILMCFKYFKSMMNTYYKLSSKKKKLESLIDLNKLSEKLDTLSKKMECLEKNLPTTIMNMQNFNSNTYFNSNANCSLSIKSSSTNLAVHSDSNPNFSFDIKY